VVKQKDATLEWGYERSRDTLTASAQF